ncbi:HEPN domain-containing protein [Pedobacter sp. HMF7647]|uniref:HEPN domain-containing protein n=1 Tax=Hufsiella arboris TaxID=2695275 RepID=A0A7K1YGH4_9SPHI|nr:HEPN domain-containing protein [Hufsiella arboris]MXV53318.1 HEPN domain-containing protein [Hufsiella arboris]
MQTASASTQSPENLPAFIRLLIETLKPEKIFHVMQQLIGEQKQELLIIILPYTCPKSLNQLQPYVDFAITGQPSITCMLHRSDWLDRQLEEGHPFYSFACTEKNLLYDTGVKPLPKLSPQLEELVLLKVKRGFDQAFERSVSFLEGAWFYFHNESNRPLTMFMLHQAAELALRAAICPFCGRQKRSHEIRVLLRCAGYYLPALTASLKIDPELAKLLDEAYMQGRYRGDWSVTNEQVNAAFYMVDRLQLAVFESMELFAGN